MKTIYRVEIIIWKIDINNDGDEFNPEPVEEESLADDFTEGVNAKACFDVIRDIIHTEGLSGKFDLLMEEKNESHRDAARRSGREEVK